MNAQIMDKVRSLYRQVERGVEPASDQIAEDNTPLENDTLRNEIFDKDMEVISEAKLLVGAILEDIADPNRRDDFSELDEQRIETAKHVVRQDPEVYLRTDWEEVVGTRVHESANIEDLSARKDLQETIELMHTKQASDEIEDMLHDMAEQEMRRKRPKEYYQAQLVHKV